MGEHWAVEWLNWIAKGASFDINDFSRPSGQLPTEVLADQLNLNINQRRQIVHPTLLVAQPALDSFLLPCRYMNKRNPPIPR